MCLLSGEGATFQDLNARFSAPPDEKVLSVKTALLPANSFAHRRVANLGFSHSTQGLGG